MATVIIPRGYAEQRELVAVPRRSYEEFLAWQKVIKSKRAYMPTTTERKAIAKAREEFAKGKYAKWEDLKNELGLNN